MQILKVHLCGLLLCLIGTPVLSQDTIYTCKDKTTASITFRNSPCTQADSVVATRYIPSSANSTDSDNLPPYVQGKPQGYWQSRIGRIEPLVDDYRSPPMPKIIVPELPASDSDKVYTHRN